jgi:hypothetical protein
MSLTATSLLLTSLLAVKVPLLVQTYDATAVSPRTLDEARSSASVVLAAAGIEPIWRPCHAGCIQRPKPPHEVMIRIVKSTPLSEPGSLGFAAVDLANHDGVLATVYLDRVDALAAQAGADRGELLGRVVAHEIGHLLLGTTRHSSIGLMRATWTAAELRRRWAFEWKFSVQEAKEMRRRLDGAPDLFGHEDTKITKAHEEPLVQE